MWILQYTGVTASWMYRTEAVADERQEYVHRSTGCFQLIDSDNMAWTMGGLPFSMKDGVACNDVRVVTDTGVCADSSDGCTLQPVPNKLLRTLFPL